MMSEDAAAHENRLRRLAERQALALYRIQKPGSSSNDEDRYWLIDLNSATIRFGGNGATLDQIEACLTRGSRPEDDTSPA